MQNFKKDFPIFENNPGLIFLDSAASTQKSNYVIDGIKNFFENDYANIHRGAYSLSEKSEELYEKSKKKVAEFIGADFVSEINYTYNSTYAFNIISQSLKKSGILQKGDKVLLSITEHHANIVPWLILKDEIGIEIDYIGIKDDYSLDLDDLKNKLTREVKAVSLTHVSNVTGEIFDLEKVGEIINNYSNIYNNYPPDKGELKEVKKSEFILNQNENNTPTPLVSEVGEEIGIKKNTTDKLIDFSTNSKGHNKLLFIVDASQAVPNFSVDVKKLNCDFLVFTAHKIMAETGLGIFYIKKELAKKLIPSVGGGGAINWVKEQEFAPAGLPHRFEPGTPNIIGAVSLLKSLEYIEGIGGYDQIKKNEEELVKYFLEKLEKYSYSSVIARNEGIQNPLFRHSEFISESIKIDTEINSVGRYNEAIQKTTPIDCDVFSSEKSRNDEKLDYNEVFQISPDNELNNKISQSKIRLIGSKNPKNRLGIFSLEIPGIHPNDLAEIFAQNNICIRAGLHCAEPLALNQKCSATLRVSLYLYNDKEDIDKFFEVLDNILNK